jgi:hypothetical protein
MIEAGRGLAAAHAAGVVHRDVKPDNVLVGNDSRARMTDFGLARFDARDPDEPPSTPPESSDLTRTGARMGTPIYMAPEQLRRGQTDARTDQWSFCAMLYEVVAGTRPFRVDDFTARETDIAAGKLEPPAQGRVVPTWLRRVIARGLAADPDARWRSMDVVVAQLVRGRGRRGRIVRTTVVAGTLAIAGVAFAGLSHGSTPQDPDEEMAVSKLWLDQRPGCNCPFSACTGRCVSQCSAHNYHKSRSVPGINVTFQQSAVLGASSDGDTILYLTGRRCSIDRLMLARRRGAFYIPIDITDQLDRRRFKIGEGCCTLAADGRSIIVPTSDQSAFVRVPLDGDTVLAADDHEFTGMFDRIDGVAVHFPVLAADGLTLYYRINDSRAPAGDSGPLDGTYSSTRRDRNAAFPPGARLPGLARTYEYVTGVSADGLSLFMTSEFRTHVLVRTSTDKPFGNPADEALPAMLPGFRAIPVEDCKRILVTWTPGGCGNEYTAWLEAEPPS